MRPRTPAESPTTPRSEPSPSLASSSQLGSHAADRAERVPAPKAAGKARRNFKLLRNGKANGSAAASAAAGDDDDDEWAFEDGSTASFPPPSTASTQALPPLLPLQQSPASAGSAAVPEPGQAEEVLVDPPEAAEPSRPKKGKGRSLVKQTSRLFSRGSASSSSTIETAPAEPTRTVRHSSVSSAASSVDSSTTGPPARPRPVASSISGRSARPGSSPPLSSSSRHSRRLSHDSAASWRPGSTRSGSLSMRDSLDPPQRASPPGSYLSASLGAARGPSVAAQSAGSSAPAVPSRMSTWFSHLLPSSSTAEPAASSPPQSDAPLPPSPLRKGPSAAASFINAAKQKAAGVGRYLLDQEAQPDKCEDTIWVMGVAHPGWAPSTPVRGSDELPAPGGGAHDDADDSGRRGSGSSGRSGRPSPPGKEGALRPLAWSARRKDGSGGPAAAPGAAASASPPGKLGHLFSASTLSLAMPTGSPSKDDKGDSPRKKDKKEKEVIRWPEQFHGDFRSCVWCTYRSQYAPIAALPQNLLLPTGAAYLAAHGPPADLAPPSLAASTFGPSTATSRAAASGWGWARDDRGLTSDAGWGCMLRTGQSMLANALMHYHLGREWRVPASRPPLEPETPAELAQLEAYAQYVKILSWFLDDPSPLCPFSVHRMALIGKELGKEVGEWFGPSTAAGALKTLANSFALAGVSVATAADSIIYRSDVFAASNLPTDDQGGRRKSMLKTSSWGKKAVLVLVGIRLGLNEVNPIYYETIKSVGIAGGRPSSSYYFVASQANSLFYLDPHFTRPAIPLKVPPSPAPPAGVAPSTPARSPAPDRSVTPAESEEDPVVVDRTDAAVRGARSPYTLDVVDVDDLSSGSETSSPSRSVERHRTITQDRTIRRSPPHRGAPSSAQASSAPSTPTPRRVAPRGDRPSSSSAQSGGSGGGGRLRAERAALPVDPAVRWYASAYGEAQTRTFHADKVRRMPLSGLDPSMLLGFLCRDEADFDDFCARVAKLPQKIFTVADEPPVWDDDEDTGLESVSEPDADADTDGAGTDTDAAESLTAADGELAPPVVATGLARPIAVPPPHRAAPAVSPLDAGVAALELDDPAEVVPLSAGSTSTRRAGPPAASADDDDGDRTPSDVELVAVDVDVDGTPRAEPRTRAGARRAEAGSGDTVLAAQAEAGAVPDLGPRFVHPFAASAQREESQHHPFAAAHAAHRAPEAGDDGSDDGGKGDSERNDDDEPAAAASVPPTPRADAPAAPPQLRATRHLLSEHERARTGSWVEPAPGASAPNGASLV